MYWLVETCGKVDMKITKNLASKGPKLTTFYICRTILQFNGFRLTYSAWFSSMSDYVLV